MILLAGATAVTALKYVQPQCNICST
jgi:hypothetical protein